MVIEVDNDDLAFSKPPSTTNSNASPTAASSCSDAAVDGAIKQWESHANTRLSNMQTMIAMEAYSIHHKQNRGITRRDIIALGYTSGYAKKILFECQNNGFLIHLEGHKQGKFKEYFLATEIDRVLQKQRDSKKQGESVDSLQLTVIQILVNETTQKKPSFHRPIIHINMQSSSTKAEYDEVFQSLTRGDGWIVKSQKNRAKVKSFKLEQKRSCTLQAYPNGKVIVAIECSLRQFKLHEADGCREFFAAVGKIEYILTREFRGFSIIPPHGEWLLKQYDMDITIPVSELEIKYPYIKHWYSKEGIKIKALGHVFQIYGKIMPICGKCLRIEDEVSIKEDVPLEQGIKDAIERPFELASAFDLLNKRKKDSGDTGGT